MKDESENYSLTPAEREPVPATRLKSRGARSERACGLSTSPGVPLEEVEPRGRRLASSLAREALRALDLRDVQRDIERRRPAEREPDPRKSKIRALKRRYPKVKGFALCLLIDNAEIEPLPTWVRDSGGKRLWRELWQHPKTKKRVTKYLSITSRGLR